MAVLRAPSRAKVRREDPALEVRGLMSDVGPVDVIVRTRYEAEEFGVFVPREMWFEVQGEAHDLDDGLNAALNASAFLIPVLALTSNAAVGELVPHLAFETTIDAQERAFFQSTIEEERGLPTPGRRVPVELTVEFLRSLGQSTEHARLRRASNQYLLALRYWRRHHDLLCVSHIFMAAEALKVVALRRAMAAKSLEELSAEWGVRSGEPRSRSLLEAEARKRLVFHGDEETEARARDISDGFEHGFTDFGSLHEPATSVRLAAAQHVRKAIFELSDLPNDSVDLLTLGRHAEPLDMDEYVRYVRGRLVGPGEVLAAEGQVYPYLVWTSKPELATGADGQITISGSETFTVRTAEGIGFRAESYEFWGPRSDYPGASGSASPDATE